MFDSNCLGTKAFELFIVLGGGLCFLLYIYIDIYIYTHTGAWLQVCQSCHEWLEPCSEVLSVLSVLFRCYHLYFRPKPAVHSHRSEQRLCGSCTARISHTLTTAVKTHLWENHCQTLRPLRLLLVSRGGFLFYFAPALCKTVQWRVHFAAEVHCSFSSGTPLPSPLPWTMVDRVLTGRAESASVSKPAGEGVLTLFQC